MNGKLYGIGTGPGDPELITVKAARILKSADVVFVPESGAEKGSIAFEIAKEYISERAEVVTLHFPMVHDETERIRSRAENARIVRSLVSAGKIAVFLTLGDPMLYSTFIYMLEYLAGSGIVIETVPGVTSFSASAAAACTPLATQNEELRIVPLDKNNDIARHLNEGENVVFMKVSSDSRRLADEISRRAGLLECVIASKCGREGESVSRDVEVLYGDVPYMTTVLVWRRRGE